MVLAIWKGWKMIGKRIYNYECAGIDWLEDQRESLLSH